MKRTIYDTRKIKYWHDGKWTHKGVKKGDQEPSIVKYVKWWDGKYHFDLVIDDATDYNRIMPMIENWIEQSFRHNEVKKDET